MGLITDMGFPFSLHFLFACSESHQGDKDRVSSTEKQHE